MRWASLLTFLLLAPVAARAADPFEIVTLGGTGRITERARADLDGDGKPEIILLSGRRAAIYRPKDGSYDAATPWRLELAADALCFDVGAVDPVPGTQEIVLITPEGIRYHSFKDGRPALESDLLIRAKNLCTRGPGGDLHRRNFVRDLDGDGREDLVLPTLEGFALFHQRSGPDGLTAGRWPTAADAVVPLELRATFSPGSEGLTGAVRGSLAVPDIRILDFNGDGRSDFGVDDGRTLTVYPAGDDGRIDPGRPAAIDLVPLAGKSGDVPRLRIRDLTGDGVPDYVVARREEGAFDIYLGGTTLAGPTYSYLLDGWAWDPFIEDLDSDGLPDLVLPMTDRVGPVAALRLAATGVLTLECHIFLNTGVAKDPETGEPVLPFRPKADLVKGLQVKIRLKVDGAGGVWATRKQLVEFRGEFSGDGRRDLVHYQGGDRLAFYAGTADGIYRKDPFLRLSIPDTEGVVRMTSEVLDLDGDGRDDLLIDCRTRDRKSDRVLLLLSRGGKK